IKKTLYEIKKLIDNERNKKIELEGLKRQATEKVAMLRNKFLNDWLLGSLDPLYKENPPKSLDIDIVSSYYLAVVVDIGVIDKQKIDKQMIKRKIGQLVQKTVYKPFKYEGFLNETDQIVFVLGSEDNDFGEIGELCESIRTMISIEYGCSA